jgi:hypothetical protein
MTRKLVLFNGAPRCGKDTAALYCIERLGAYAFKFSAPIKAGIKAAFNLSDRDVEYLESIKGEPTPILLGKSYREVQISFSEAWAKPFFGEDVFGQLAVNSLQSATAFGQLGDLVVCSDSGFPVEAWPVIENVFGTENTLLVRVHREGKTFAGDSRSYIELPGVKMLHLENRGTLQEYGDAVVNLVDSWLNNRSPF